MSDSERLTPAQERAVAALLASPTLESAAREARVSTATLRRWRQEDDFNRAYRLARCAVLEGTTARLRQASAQAVELLVSIMGNLEARDSDRIRSAQIVLEMSYRSSELEDLAESVEEVLAHVGRIDQALEKPAA